MRLLVLVILLPVLATSRIIHGDIKSNEIKEDECNLPEALKQEIRSYETVANTIINSLVNGKYKGGTYKELAKFVDTFGARVSGTENLEDAIDYALDLMKDYELENVHGEEAQVPHWVRNHEIGELVSPRKASLPVLGLGSSVSTPEEGIEAEVIVVNTFDELRSENVSREVKGKIVVYNEEYVSYGETVQYRSQGASEASRLGAVASLIGSVTPFSMSTLHTGWQDYDDGVTPIPTACITKEDARLLQRYQDRGEKIVVKLNLSYTRFSDSTSRNSVGEIEGNTDPKKVVLVSGHLDSWDVGVGAMDDGGGAFISWYALAVLKGLGLRAKRTLRAVLWTAEEPGLVGWAEYNRTHFEELSNFTFVMESDEGTFTPLGIEYAAGAEGGCIIQEIVNLLAPINATQAVASKGGVGSDISSWTSHLIPGASLLNANEKYFWFHHTQADRMEVLDPDDLDRATALWAVVSYIIADLTEDFPRTRDNAQSNIVNVVPA
ncbi:carboxypeptidase Q [Dendroctonus ponderosae]|uniref:Carboxypeptidase Q n=1 Tax=Dendroctonus ponderosae TaxID=77166 RepID=A0AAR5PC80_DENPD|nr:carboxypeptidase Q [Dendroctonus ponderosae]XP_019757909.1 carboxypeptidase Q [Dendroctonus ponderosae]XP_019757916.1 carboxypeptidase Q [Dendroctonus ponderosae]XP_019757924.1 carboxypeptidase Q [Dendroctonus ponderosae]XP_019757933.1 carboxypeptidase Q [Dendroctonus ponderosae]XP_048524658.1 carboxypeptidase Q [Dendroctonus ponderosae]